MSEPTAYPRTLSERERSWLHYLLPEERPRYREMLRRMEKLTVLGEGRWGRGDLVLGIVGQEIDRTEGMTPVVAYGEVLGRTAGEAPVRITLSVHEPNADDMVEFQVANLEADHLPDHFVEERRWAYSRWLPGEPCPATGHPVRTVTLDAKAELLLVLSKAKRVLWLYDGADMSCRLIPVTNFYNELMLSLGVRDPKLLTAGSRLFTELESFEDHDLRHAFRIYNTAFRKVEPARIADNSGSHGTGEKKTVGKRLRSFFGGGKQ